MSDDVQVIGPKSEKQEKFINSKADVTVFGGAAGSGKSYLGVMDFLQYVHLPTFRGLITRRTTPQLKGPGGILDNALTLYKTFDPKVKWKDKDGKFVFSSGAEVFLKHFETEADKDNYQGMECNFFLVDEGQQFLESQVFYLMSRMRNPKCPEVPPHMKITCNPDYNSFLREWIEWYLYPEGHELAGRPDPEKDGVIRYFVVNNGQLIWGSSPEELVKETECDPNDPLSFVFLGANVYDNPVVMEKNPKYVSWLKGLPRVEKERLLFGNWFAREEAAGYFKREWVKEIDRNDVPIVSRVRAWDLAGTLPSDAYPDPDYTASVLMSKDEEGNYLIEEVTRTRVRVGELQNLMLETAARDGEGTMIIIPMDPGVAGKAWAQTLSRALINEGYTARLRPTSKSKIDRFNPFAVAAENGFIKIIKNCFHGTPKDSRDNSTYYTELEQFDGTRKFKDDMVDCTGDAFMALNQRKMLADFSKGLVDLSKPNPLKNL